MERHYRRFLPRLRTSLTWLALMSVPLGFCLALSYGLSLWHFRSEANSLASASARRAAEIFRSGDVLLANLEKSTAGECNAQTIALMNQAVFHSTYFREAGIERDGNLVCTSLTMLPAGFTIENSKRKPATRVGSMEILSPTKTIQGGQSLILNRPINAQRTHFVNLLLDPQVLIGVTNYDAGVKSTTLFDDTPNGRFLVLGSTSTMAGAEFSAPINEGVHRGPHGLVAITRAGRFPVYSVISISYATIGTHWRTQMRPAVVAGFMCSVLALLLLRRYLPRQSAADDLRSGIKAGEMLVEYQPIVDARSARIVGAEALVRWRHPNRGLVMPDDFIPLAESTGLIQQMTEKVLIEVKRDLESLDLPVGFRISVNLARTHLADPGLFSFLDRLFGSEARLDQLAFEITERELLANVAEQARSTVSELARRGALVSLDDFGTGYSGLSNLRHLTIHYLKIDRSFVGALNTEAVSASLVGNIVLLAESLQMGMVAEGVETEQQRDKLLKLGVHLQQGWLYGKSMHADALRERLAAQPKPEMERLEPEIELSLQ